MRRVRRWGVAVGLVTVGLVAVGGALLATCFQPATFPYAPPPAPCPTAPDSLDAAVTCLSVGTFTWNPPEQMTVGDETTVAARVGVGRAPVSTQGIPGAKPPEQVAVGMVMAVDLLADQPEGLNITAEDPNHREQPILSEEGYTFADWRWQVHALTAGRWQLRLRIFVRLVGQSLPVKEVTAATHVQPVVDVRVDSPPPWQQAETWLTHNGQFLVTSVIAAAAALGGLTAFRTLAGRRGAPATAGGGKPQRRRRGRPDRRGRKGP